MRRPLSALMSAIVLVFGVLLVNPAAYAAEGTLTITPSATTIAPGESVTIDWESQGVQDIELVGDWPSDGPTTETQGSETLTLINRGTYTFTITGFHADEPDVEITAEVDVVVEGDLVSITAQCGAFTITNLRDLELEGGYGSFDEDEPDEWIELGPFESQTFTTTRTSVDISIGHTFGDGEQHEGVAIPQDCDGDDNNGSTDDDSDDDSATGSSGASGYPTVAPKAGINDGASVSPVAAAAIALLIGAGIAARRLRSHS